MVDIAEHMTLRVRGKLETGTTFYNLRPSEEITAHSIRRLNPSAAGSERGIALRVENGNHIYFSFSGFWSHDIKFDGSGNGYLAENSSSNTDIYKIINGEKIPEEIRPKYGFTLRIFDRRMMIQVSVFSTGEIRIDKILSLDHPKSILASTNGVSLEIYGDYWI